MNPFYLKYFLDAAKNKSISKSAKINFVSHSAVSQAIVKLEEELEIELVEHQQRKFKLTSQGQLSIAFFENLLNHHARVKSTLSNSKSEPMGELSIAAPQSLVVDTLSNAVIEFRKLYPKVRIRLNTGATHFAMNQVIGGSANCGIIVRNYDHSDVENVTISQGHFVLVSKTAKLNLRQCRFLLTSTDKVEIAHLRKAYLDHFHRPLQCDDFILSWGLIKEFAMKDFGLGYLPEFVVKKELAAKKLFVVKQPWEPFHYRINFIWNRNHGLDRNTKLFLNLLKKESK